MKKFCKVCNKKKAFHPSGKTGMCEDCHNNHSKNYRQSHKDSINKQKSEQRKLVRELINGYKESKGCCECKAWHPHYLLDFDHLDGDKKIDSISRMITQQISIQKIMVEIKKCEVVCKNHHAERTHKRSLALTGSADI